MSLAGMDFDDHRWTSLLGGYRVPYDPRNALLALERGEDVEAAWQELCTELYHQGGIGQASYAAVPHLVRIHELRGVPDWHKYALVAMIEAARHSGQNHDLPANLRESYEEAWRQLVRIGVRELETAEAPTLVSSIIAVIAMGKGQFNLGRFAVLFDEDEREATLTEAGLL